MMENNETQRLINELIENIKQINNYTKVIDESRLAIKDLFKNTNTYSESLVDFSNHSNMIIESLDKFTEDLKQGIFKEASIQIKNEIPGIKSEIDTLSLELSKITNTLTDDIDTNKKNLNDIATELKNTTNNCIESFLNAVEGVQSLIEKNNEALDKINSIISKAKNLDSDIFLSKIEMQINRCIRADEQNKEMQMNHLRKIENQIDRLETNTKEVKQNSDKIERLEKEINEIKALLLDIKVECSKSTFSKMFR